MLSTPLDRGSLLRGRAVGRLVLLLVPGIVVGAIIADAGGFRHQQALACAAVGAACALSAGGVAMWLQRQRVAGTAPGRGWLWCCVVLAGAAVPANLQTVDRLDSSTLWFTAGIAAIVGLAAATLGLTGVGLIPLSTLAAGSGASSSVALAIADQSLSPLAVVLAAPPGRRRSHAAAATA